MTTKTKQSKFRYFYRPTHMEVNGATVYVCIRNEQEWGKYKVLWFARKKDGRWVAYGANVDSTEPCREGKKLFKTKFAIDDIATHPGDVEWLWYYTKGEKVKDFAFLGRTERIGNPFGCCFKMKRLNCLS